jgi:hypothetical protein
MFDERLEHTEWHGTALATGQCRLDQVLWVTDTGHHHKGLEVVVRIDRYNLTDQLHPVQLMSPNRPMNGETHQAPAFTTSNACVGEKHLVTLTLIPFAAIHFVALSPSRINGT